LKAAAALLHAYKKPAVAFEKMWLYFSAVFQDKTTERSQK
jgi:hypothetical protein